MHLMCEPENLLHLSFSLGITHRYHFYQCNCKMSPYKVTLYMIFAVIPNATESCNESKRNIGIC